MRGEKKKPLHNPCIHGSILTAVLQLVSTSGVRIDRRGLSRNRRTVRLLSALIAAVPDQCGKSTHTYTISHSSSDNISEYNGSFVDGSVCGVQHCALYDSGICRSKGSGYAWQRDGLW